MKKGVSPIISVVFLLIVVISALAVFRAWYLREAQRGQITISALTKEKGTQTLEDLIVENCDGQILTIRNKGINDIYLRRDGRFMISLYRQNLEIDPASVTFTPNNDVLPPGQIVRLDMSGAGGIPLGQTIKLTTENRYSLYFSYSIGSVVVSADPTDIWANDGSDSTYADRSIVTAYVTDSFGNPINTANSYPIVSFYVDNGTVSTTGIITDGKVTAEYRSTSYVTGEIKINEGVWYHYDQAIVTASISETADGTSGGTVIRSVRGSVLIDYKTILHSYEEYPTATGASIDTNGIANRYGDATSADIKLRYHDNQRISQISYDSTANKTSGQAFPGTSSDGQWTEIYFHNALPSSITDADYVLNSVKVDVYHYETGVDLPYPLDYRDDIWVNDNGSTGTWRRVQDFSLISSIYGPFLSQNLVSVNYVSIINTIAKAKDIHIRLFYNPCYWTGSQCSTAGSDVTGDGVADQYSYASYIDYAAVIIEYTKKNP